MRSDVIAVSGGVTNGLYDFQARELPPTQGRWLSPDPAGVDAVDILNPQSLNRFSYVFNNPLQFIDPTGEYCDYSDHEDPASGYDPAQFDFHSSRGECHDHEGQWVDDAFTQNGADLEGRPDYSVVANTATDITTAPSFSDDSVFLDMWKSGVGPIH